MCVTSRGGVCELFMYVRMDCMHICESDRSGVNGPRMRLGYGLPSRIHVYGDAQYVFACLVPSLCSFRSYVKRSPVLLDVVVRC